VNIARVFGRIIGLSAVFATLMVIVFYSLGKTRRVVHARAQDESATTGCTLGTITGSYGALSSFAAYNGGLMPPSVSLNWQNWMGRVRLVLPAPAKTWLR